MLSAGAAPGPERSRLVIEPLKSPVLHLQQALGSVGAKAPAQKRASFDGAE
jgi:hypothetical protein